MTRRRRLPLVLRVCIGVFVLLFSTIVADTTKEPPPSSGKQIGPDASETSIFERNSTTLNKIPSRDESDLASTGKKNQPTSLYNSTGKDFERVFEELTKDANAEDEEKVPMPIGEEPELQGIRSRDQLDRLSTADSASGGSKLEEIIYGTSGKSSSTKTQSEDSYRSSRTNSLTMVTAKPALEESKVDEKKNRTVQVQRFNVTKGKQEANETARSQEEPKEERESDATAEGGSSSKETATGSNLKLEMANAGNESAPRKVRFLEKFQERRKKSENPSVRYPQNSEVPDLKEADGNKEGDRSISLINDTYVNYSQHYKASTERNPGGNQPRAFENATNFINEESVVTHEPPDPKEEVEVVGNVTHPASQRIAEQRAENSTPKDAGLANELSQRSSRNEDSLGNSTKAAEIDRVVERQTNGNKEGRKEEINESSRQQPVQVATERTVHEEVSTLQGPSSPVPRGRTIAFSGANEFPSLEVKPTVASKLDVPFSRKNVTDNVAEQKPYPYAKPTVREQLVNVSNQVDVTTEEASALENTIGKGQSEEKFIVTEASDVLENSIQQFKPNYYEKASNESSTVSSEVRSSVPMTTASLGKLEEASSTNSTPADGSGDPKGSPKPEEKSTSAGNDVPRWSESREAITGKEGSFDVTGNGITEVSLKPESGDKRVYEASAKEIAARTTSAPLTTASVEPQTDLRTLSNVDVQTNAEGSLLMRSTLNATELSTEYPLIKGNISDKEKSTVRPTSLLDTGIAGATESATVLPTTTIEETSTGNVTESPRASDANGTNEIPSGASGTLSPDESLATTTTIEYEFVGLSESTTLPSRNIAQETAEGRELPTENSSAAPTTVHDLSTKNASNEATTMSDESTTDNVSSTVETETTNIDDRTSSIPVTDQTIVPTSTQNPTTLSKDELTTQTSTIEGEIDRDTTKVNVDSWSTTSEEEVATTTAARTEQTVSSDSKDSHYMANITEPPVEFTSISNVNATDATRAATSSPFVPISLEPRIPVSSSTSAPTASGMPTDQTIDRKMSPTQESQVFVRIDMEGSWYDVCPKVPELKPILAEILTTELNRSVSDKQIMFHQDPCQEPPSSTPTPSDMPIMSIRVYVVDENGKYDSAMTKILPSLYHDSQDRVKFPVTIHRFLLVQETIPDSGNAIAVVVVSSVAFICLVLLAGLLFIMRKRQTRFNYGERCRPVSLDAYSLDSVSAYNSVRRKGVARSSKRSYGNPTFEDSSAIPSHPLNFAGLSSFCNDINAINEEFTGIPQVSAKIDELPSGAEVKNRYANGIPLPETRVPLQKINNDPLTEYINASYVRGPKNATRYYIACQAPMESTVTDFWRMIWEQQCKVIIMLTDLVENGVEKCTEYIPPSEVTDCHRLYGDYQVTLKKRETKEKYAISTLHLKNLENNTFREVYHIWYLWPVDGVQSDGAGLIAVLLEARALQRGGPGPIVVHCSPGTGRTGTLIALDLGIRQYEITRTVDVPRVVYTIRRDRAGAVQTKEQYAFIYKALNLYATKLAGGVLEST